MMRRRYSYKNKENKYLQNTLSRIAGHSPTHTPPFTVAVNWSDSLLFLLLVCAKIVFPKIDVKMPYRRRNMLLSVNMSALKTNEDLSTRYHHNDELSCERMSGGNNNMNYILFLAGQIFNTCWLANLFILKSQNLFFGPLEMVGLYLMEGHLMSSIYCRYPIDRILI